MSKITMTDKSIAKEIRRRIQIAEGDLRDVEKAVANQYPSTYPHTDEITFLIGGRWQSRKSIIDYSLLPLYRDLSKLIADYVED